MLQMTNIPGPRVILLVPDARLNTVLRSEEMTQLMLFPILWRWWC